MHHRLRELHPLAHPLAVGANPLVGRVQQIDRLQRFSGRRGSIRLGQAVEPCQRRDPLQPGHPLVERVLLGAEPQPGEETWVAPDRLSEHPHRPFARLELSGDQLQEGGFAGAIRPQQTGDAGPDLDRDVVEADDLAIPLRHPVDGHHRCGHVTTSTPRTRRSSTNSDSAISPTTTTRDSGHGDW